MSEEDKKLLREMEELQKDMMDVAVTFREELPAFSFKAYQVSMALKKAGERITDLLPKNRQGVAEDGD